MKKTEIRRNMKTATIMLAAITTAVWLALIIVKFFVGGMQLRELFDEILSNILGILPPIILFNFAYEYITKDYMADEISEEITQTLMSNPRALEAFDKDIKREFVKSTIASLVGPDKIDAVYGAIEPYLIYQHNVRSSFDYSIEIRHFQPEAEKDPIWRSFFDAGLYYKVKEKFSCQKILTGFAAKSNEFRLGFFSNLSQLDSELKNQNYLFRENLTIRAEELQALAAMTDEEKCRFVVETMRLNVYLNQIRAELVSCTVDENGIIAELKTASFIDSQNDIEMEIGFYMPQLKKPCEFLVSITEPTLAPKIHLLYDENTMEVRTYPFLDEEADLLEKASQMPGEVYICPKGWIYPIKGVVFIVDER